MQGDVLNWTGKKGGCTNLKCFILKIAIVCVYWNLDKQGIVIYTFIDFFNKL